MSGVPGGGKALRNEVQVEQVWGPYTGGGTGPCTGTPQPMDRQTGRYVHLVLHLLNIFTLLSDLSHGKLHLVRYKPDDPEDHEPGEERGTAVTYRYHERIPENDKRK